jgi:hypothetical protein
MKGECQNVQETDGKSISLITNIKFRPKCYKEPSTLAYMDKARIGMARSFITVMEGFAFFNEESFLSKGNFIGM